MKYCPYCGEPLPARSYKFCPECGERLAQEDERPVAPESVPQTPPARPKEPLEIDPEEQTAAPENFVRYTQSREIPPEDALPLQTQSVPEPEPAWPQEQSEPLSAPPAPYVDVETFEEEPEALLRPDGWVPDAEEHFTEPPHARYPKKRARARVLPIFLAVVLVLACGGGYAALKLRQNGAPEREAERLASSVYTGAVQTLLDVTETSGSGLGSAEAVATMCLAVKEGATQQQFREHLLAMGDPAAPGYNEALSGFEFRQTKDTLFSQKFKLRVTAVPVLVKTSVADAVIYVDGEQMQTEAVDGGLLLHLAPGRHTLRAVYGGYGTEYELGSAEVASLSATVQREVTLSQKTAALSIELAGVETDLTLKVDGRGITPQTTGGWITLDPAFVGMEIELSCKEYAQTLTVTAPGKQVLAVDYIGILEQKNPAGRDPDPDMLTNRQLVDKLGKRFYTCYRSYLDASNRKDETLIRDADDDYKAALVENIENYNSGYQFEFKSIEVDRRSVSRSEKEGERFATVRVEVLYNYAKRADTPSWLAGFNRQDVTLRYDEDKSDWVVYGSRVDDTLELSEDTFTIT